jgi:hypothetical protein
MFCHDTDNIQAPIKKFQRQELDQLQNNEVIALLTGGYCCQMTVIQSTTLAAT